MYTEKLITKAYLEDIRFFFFLVIIVLISNTQWIHLYSDDMICSENYKELKKVLNTNHNKIVGSSMSF